MRDNCIVPTRSIEEGLILIKAVVFDLDGTLFKFILDYVGMRNAVRDTVIAEGVPASKLEEDDRIRDFVNKMLDFAKSSKWSKDKVSQTMKRVNLVMDKYEWESARKNSPMDGALELLRDLRKMRLKTGLLTNNSKRGVTYLLEKYGFNKMLDVVVTRDDLGDFNNLKPSSVGLKRVLARLGVKADEAIYVGDSVVDVKAALGVGVKPVFVSTGYSSEKEAKDTYPDILVIERLPLLLQTLS
jgi:HAD superfamily hydrolase (TIGR01509 family)